MRPAAADLRAGPLLHPADGPQAAWWRHAVIYQIYPRSWSDSDGDGIGDLPGITDRLPYLADLGVDAVWISPFYPSPQADGGYDVSDYRAVDPRFGTLDDADRLIDRAHQLGLKVVIDVVPNHSSDEHPWFQEALAAAPGSPERARYVFRSGRGPGGNAPPTNWPSIFGGSAWSQVETGDPSTGRLGQWYLHLFDARQPDFNWENPEVRDEFEAVLRFWLDRGVDGFRVDVAHALVKDPAYPDLPEDIDAPRTRRTRRVPAGPMWDQDGVHEVYRAWRRLLDEYGESDAGAERILCAEAWVAPIERIIRYIRSDEMHQAFNFDFLVAAGRWSAPELVSSITRSLDAADSVGAPTTWVLSNHDVIRHASRLGYPPGTAPQHGIRATDPQPDAAVGLRRALAVTTLMLALPGSAYLYQGEELGLPDHTALPDDVRQDPVWERSGQTVAGRDGCRVPLPWCAEDPAFGFSPTGQTWLPQPRSYRDLAVDRQRGVPDSPLELYRTLLRVRRERGLGSGSLRRLEGIPDDVVGFVNTDRDGSRTLVLVNLGRRAIVLPPGELLVASSAGQGQTGVLGTDEAAWVALDTSRPTGSNPPYPSGR